MKVLHRLIVLLLITTVACKQATKTDIVAEEANQSVVDNQPEKQVELLQETVQKEKEQTIEEFLKQLQTAVKNNDVAKIEQSLKFPFEFNSGGESIFYNNYQELKEGTRKFFRILKAKSIEKEGEMFIITYQDPEDIEYFVAFIAVKDGDSFKLTTFMQPH
ncbi:hypothetical protein [Aquimarina longa]|uniref:hypothetical protein n=1 Tax=Aquimarina longa TaxID=1080221 RepID=UPI0007815EB4|nr:hypothetical protein [Aquimarina longa]